MLDLPDERVRDALLSLEENNDCYSLRIIMCDCFKEWNPFCEESTPLKILMKVIGIDKVVEILPCIIWELRSVADMEYMEVEYRLSCSLKFLENIVKSEFLQHKLDSKLLKDIVIAAEVISAICWKSGLSNVIPFSLFKSILEHSKCDYSVCEEICSNSERFYHDKTRSKILQLANAKKISIDDEIAEIEQPRSQSRLASDIAEDDPVEYIPARSRLTAQARLQQSSESARSSSFRHTKRSEVDQTRF